MENYKHQTAYDGKGRLWSLIDIIKNSNEDSKWYFDKKGQVVLSLKNSPSGLGRRYLSHKTGQTYTASNGQKIEFDKAKNSESDAHYNFKMNIVLTKKFVYKRHNVLMSNAEEEKVFIENNFFRTDVFGTLKDGKKCAIEVIRTSDVSEEKREAIDDGQILTFKIYIDEKGNQIHERDFIIGSWQVERIRKETKDTQFRVIQLTEKVGDAERGIVELTNRIAEARHGIVECRSRIKTEGRTSFCGIEDTRDIERRNEFIRIRIKSARIRIGELEVKTKEIIAKQKNNPNKYGL